MKRAQGEQDETQWINATRYNVFKPVNTEKLECGSSPDYVQGQFCVDTVKLVDCQVKVILPTELNIYCKQSYK